jgi:carbon-monoxide dehydrogenase medium subunit
MTETFAALADEDAKILAGGHSLIPLMKLRLARPSVLVDVSQVVPAGITVTADGGARVGAGTTWRDVAAAPDLAGCFGALRDGAAATGDLQVRNRGTIGGGLCHADPAADIPAAALALDARLVISSPGAERTESYEGFVSSPFETSLGGQDVVTAICLPAQPAGTGSAYQSVENAASGYPVAGAAALVSLDEQARITACRIGITGAAARGYRPGAAEAGVLGWSLAAGWDELCARVRPAAGGVSMPQAGPAGPGYLTAITRLVTARAVRRAVLRAAGQEDSP